MKAHYILLAAAALMVSACAESVAPIEEEESIQITIHATQEGGLKTTVIEGGTQVYWEPTEVIKVFFNGTGARFQSTNTEQAETADFIGYLPISVGSNEGGTSNHPTWGLYPYRADATADDSSVTTTLPANQKGRAGSFGKDVHITLACSDDYNMAFYNVTGGVRFSLTQEGINSVIFKGNNDEVLAGKIALVFEDGVPVVSNVITGETTITLNAPAGETFQTGKWYYIETLPVALNNGFKMVFNMAKSTATRESTTAVDIKRGRYGSLAEVDAGLVFDEEGSDPSEENIVFADEDVKAKLVAKFDTNGDGEISYEEAAAVTSLDGVFGAIKTYKSFDEFQFFTGITTIADYQFSGWVMTSISLPESVTAIGSQAFINCTKLLNIDIPVSVKSIGSWAFCGCTSLSSVVIPVGVNTIGDAAFRQCTSLTSVVIPESVTSLGESVFYDCTSLASIVIPESVDTIGDAAFRQCTSLTSVVIPESVTSLGESVFYDCTSLASIVIPESLTNIGRSAFGGCSSLTSIVIPESVRRIASYAFSRCSSLASVVIPESVTIIDTGTFYGCTSLSSVVVPKSISSIIYQAFYGCTSLTSIIIPESVQTIGDSAFGACTGLTSVEIPESVNSIGEEAFRDCKSLASVVIPESVTSIGNGAFSGCTSLTSIVIPKYVTSIAASTFYDCTSLTSILIPESVATIGEGAFWACARLTSIDLPESLKSIGESAFRDCTSLTSVIIPNVISIGRFAFYRCSSLSSIEIPESVTRIEDFSFLFCTSLISIVIPKSVTSIGQQAFYGCTKLSSITVEAITPPTLGPSVFWNTENCPIYVPSTSVDAYKSTWSEYAERIFAKESKYMTKNQTH